MSGGGEGGAGRGQASSRGGDKYQESVAAALFQLDGIGAEGNAEGCPISLFPADLCFCSQAVNDSRRQNDRSNQRHERSAHRKSGHVRPITGSLTGNDSDSGRDSSPWRRAMTALSADGDAVDSRGRQRPRPIMTGFRWAPSRGQTTALFHWACLFAACSRLFCFHPPAPQGGGRAKARQRRSRSRTWRRS